MKNRVVYEFLSGKGDMPYKDILEPYIKAIKNLIAIRTKTIKLFFIANHDTWNDKFYEMARKVASEARKIRLEDPDQLDDSPISMPTAPSSSQPQKQKRLENIITTISQEERQMTPAQEQQKQQQDEKVQTASNVNDVLDQPSESAHNTSNSRSLEGIHPARAEMIGLLKSSSAPVVSAPPIDIEEDRSACQPLSSNIIQENVSISNNSIPTVASPFSTPMQVLPPSHNNIQHNPVENNTRSNSFVSVANHQHGESSRNDPMDTTMMTLVNNKRPVSALEDHVSKEPSLDTSKRSRLKKSGVDNTETMDKILDFSEWHAATKSMLEWLGSVLKTSK
ncbi:hypothetical protein BDA99DRAFT_124770 [Phascolomyces articulosus]|uniref:Uncharacterized protein n=1 Tax=Phascolomyces articulosus TaxID=60185 RepID=A0AAD5KAT5_9FUNG|nr:hypothetical protein BDA99DRAFT_124770 [Phascolomyces articulosus]